MREPSDYLDNATGQWGRIHRGHNLDTTLVEADFRDRFPGAEAVLIDEVVMRLTRPTIHCDVLGCDERGGEYHRHWVGTINGEPFTIVLPGSG